MSVIFTCGGTGGHLYPAIAVAQTLRDRGTRCLFLMANDREDIAHVAHYGFEAIPIGPSRGSILAYLLSMYQAWKALKKAEAALVFCTGGKITLAVAVAAWLRRVPVAVMEQNAIPGRANRVIAKWATRVFVTFSASQRYFPDRCTRSGNPVRQQFPDDLRVKTALAQIQKGTPTILVLGGSQGATRLNTCVLDPRHEALNSVPATWIILTGKRFATENSLPDFQTYTIGQRTLLCMTYCEAMDQLYHAADVVISRAGATTISEILAFQKPAILIPYPHAKDNHQEANARAICEETGYRWCLESQLNGDFLAETLPQLIGTTPSVPIPDARRIIADWAQCWIQKKA